MPFYYSVSPGVSQTTSGTTNTEIDHLFIKPGTGRTSSVRSCTVHGKANGLSTISGITFRWKTWTSTASSGGTGLTPAPRDGTVQASKSTAGYGTTSGVTSGTGGPSVHVAFGCGASGPGGWTAEDADAVIGPLESGATKSNDLFSSAINTSLVFESSVSIIE